MRNQLVAAILGLFVLAGPAHAVLIDFDDGIQTNVIGGFYSALGVTFSGATWQDNLGLVGFSGPNGLGSTNAIVTPGASAYNWTSATPVIATFSFAVSTVSLTAMDLGENGFTLNAYDAAVGGNLVGSMTLFGVGLGNNNAQIVSVAAPGILRVEMFQAAAISEDGVIVEDFQFATAPEPGTLALLALGLVAGGMTRRAARQW